MEGLKVMRTSMRLTVVSMVLFIAGCAMHWQPQVNVSRDNRPTEKSSQLLAIADDCFLRAGDLEKLETCEQAYISVLDANPGDYHALTQLSTISILVGTAYTRDSMAKTKRFRKAMFYAEQAMYTNGELRARVADGETIWEAAGSLTKNEVEAIFFWVTALQYEFKEGMSFPKKIVNVRWLQRALSLLERIETLAPEFGGGGVEFAKAICYYALPTIYGGAEEKGDRAMQDAVNRGEDWLLPRWGRGKYYYVITDQPDKSREDLRWVATRNPQEFKDPYPWRIHFIENSTELLR